MCRLSKIAWKGIDDEWEEDYKDHYPANGHIKFTELMDFTLVQVF